MIFLVLTELNPSDLNQTNDTKLKSNAISFNSNVEENPEEASERTKKPHVHRPKISQSQQVIQFDKSGDSLKKLKDDEIPKSNVKSIEIY